MDNFNREDRTSDYVCTPCGLQFLSEKQKAQEGGVHTAHLAKCGVCGKEDTVLHIRVYNWLFKPKEDESR